MTIEPFTSDSIPIPSDSSSSTANNEEVPLQPLEKEESTQSKQSQLPPPPPPQPSSRKTKSTICTHCSSQKSPLWRRGQHNEVLCNACGLYWKHHSTYRPLDGSLVSRSARQSPKPKPASIRRPASAVGSFGSAILSSSSSTTMATSKPPHPSLLISNSKRRKEKADEYLFYIKTENGGWRGESSSIPTAPKNSLSAMLASPVQSPLGGISLVPPPPAQSSTIVPLGDDKLVYTVIGSTLLFVGDFCAIRADDGNIYYVIIRDFWIPTGGVCMASVEWLLPKPRYALEVDGISSNIKEWMFDRSSTTVDPSSMNIEDHFVDVFYSPRRDIGGLGDGFGIHNQHRQHQYCNNPQRPEAIRSDGVADLREMEQIAAAALLCEIE